MTRPSVDQFVRAAEQLHNAADQAACEGDYKTADALRLLEGNARGGEVMRRWAFANLLATEPQIRSQARHLALGWGASEDALYNQAMAFYRDAAAHA